MDNENTMYLIVMITNTSKHHPNANFEDFMKMTDEEMSEWMEGQTTEPVAIYSDFETAARWMDELADQIEGTADEGSVWFDIMGMPMDEDPPQLLLDLRAEEELLRNTIQDILIRLMKQDLVDQLIGEDGKFYYEITDKGREKLKEMPPEIKHMLDKKRPKKDEDDVDLDEL